jgi:hypothetical protein
MTVVLDHHKFNLASRAGLDAFLVKVDGLLDLARAEKAAAKSEKKAQKKADEDPKSQVADTTSKDKSDKTAKTDKKASKEKNSDLVDEDESADEESQSTDDDSPSKGERDWSSKKVKNGLKGLKTIAEDMQSNKLDTQIGVHQIQEISWAIESNFIPQYAWRKSIDLGDFILNARNLLLNACGRGSADNPAWNLSRYDVPDLSLVDPKPSSFWVRPNSIADKDLFTPYDRKVNPDMADSICTYASPHKGNGAHPSFEVTWHDSKWKVKFDEEQSSGPFASRIFWALGFPVDIYDFTPIVKVRWDKRILTKFNSRKLNSMQLKIAHIPITTLRANKYYNPFDYIGYAVLKDGSRISSAQLREKCFPVAAGKKLPARPELDHSLYNKEFGKTIDYVALTNASFTTKEPADGVKEIGYWDYNNLNHSKLREVRAMCILNAWLGNWDTRWANNRFYLVDKKEGEPQLKQVVSDLGALFGNSTGMIRYVNGKLKVNVYQNAPNDFPWTFTHPQDPGMSTVPIHDYMPDFKTDPFYEMNIDDARWMARLIAQLTEQQLKSALIGAGYEAPRARLILEKLVARRDKMIQDLGLSDEIKPLRAHPIDRKFSYDPRTDGEFEVTISSGERVAARNTGKFTIRNGFLVTLPTPQAPPSQPLAQYSSRAPYRGLPEGSPSQRP